MHQETINQATIDYAEQHTTAHSAALANLADYTYRNVMQPRMLSGHVQGRVLALLSQLMQPNKILEIGTYTGYSALCLAEGLRSGGMLHTIDVNDELEHIRTRFWQEANFQDRITFHHGQAADIIPTLNQTNQWDIVFIDADKSNYRLYYDLVINAVRPGGIILSDNVLWNGKVANPEAYPKDKELPGIMAYNTYCHQDSRTENILLPIRDGLMVSRKL